MATTFVDTHCNVPNVLRALNVDYKDAGQTWHSLLPHFPSPSAPWTLAGCISVSSDMESHFDTLELMKCENVYGAFGIHPLYAYEYEDGEKYKVEAMSHTKTVAYGEIGLDYHEWPESYNYAKPELQKQIFISQLKHALELQKPIIIHTREAEDDTFDIMKQYIPQDWKVHVHCFTDTLSFCQRLINEWPNLFVGFTGVITFKNSKALQNVVKELPLDRLLLETDAPFMTPEPYRAKVAQLKGIPIDEVYAACKENTKKMYGVDVM